VQLAAGAKLTQDLKAALLLVCGVLKQTSFVQPDVSWMGEGWDGFTCLASRGRRWVGVGLV
jgi:hypothetical protein